MSFLNTHCDIIERYRGIRQLSLKICEPLTEEDSIIQSMPDVSPPKWHLAHTTWFFEAFLLSRFQQHYKPFHDQYHYLFNSYYNSLGPHWDRSKRGLLSRPELRVILEYRNRVDEQVQLLIERCPPGKFDQIERILLLGMNHEQQHQELLVTDIKHILCTNPLRPRYFSQEHKIEYRDDTDQPMGWISFPKGRYEIGAGENEFPFTFDNEHSSHEVLISDFQLSSRLVSNQEYLEFIEDQGYSNARLWLSQGWDAIQTEKWEAPLYWEKLEDQWWVATLHGFEPVRGHDPVVHLSYFEADAFARWKGVRLPTEAEWEVAARSLPTSEILNGNFLNQKNQFRPLSPQKNSKLQQVFGDAWEWTMSAYLPYPGFKSLSGPEGEYNGKFMLNQMVLRGGSCATPPLHIRTTYRNYFPPQTRWQFSGIRLAI